METLIETKRGELADLCRRHRVRQLELFGSTARDQFAPETSDLDFLVEFDAIPPSEHAHRYFSLLFALTDLFGCDVDLVETGAIRNPYFRRAIATDRVLLYAARGAKAPV
jgi:predicted nucleotidyltransferase